MRKLFFIICLLLLSVTLIAEDDDPDLNKPLIEEKLISIDGLSKSGNDKDSEDDSDAQNNTGIDISQGSDSEQDKEPEEKAEQTFPLKPIFIILIIVIIALLLSFILFYLKRKSKNISFVHENRGNNMGNKTGRFISASVRGANHVDKGMPCQDAATSAILYHKGYKYYFMAVADGHGGSAYTRSDIGSFLALQAASEAANRFVMFVLDVFEKYPDNWVDLVKKDFQDRFGKMLVSNWVRMVESHASEIENNPTEIIKLYGTTISVALVINDRIFAGKIGDGSIYSILFQNKNFEVKDIFESEEQNNTNLGLGTASLCSRDAFRKWQIQTLPIDDIRLLFLSTDGFSDSLKDAKNELLSFYIYMLKKGIVNFERMLDAELKQISNKGVGDDISTVFFLPDLQGRIS